MLINVVSIVSLAFEVYNWLIIARVILSWVQVPYNPLIRFIYEITEPVLAPLRRLMPQGSTVDFSPLIAILVLQLLQKLIVMLIAGIL